jgi:hypothetical protein
VTCGDKISLLAPRTFGPLPLAIAASNHVLVARKGPCQVGSFNVLPGTCSEGASSVGSFNVLPRTACMRAFAFAFADLFYYTIPNWRGSVLFLERGGFSSTLNAIFLRFYRTTKSCLRNNLCEYQASVPLPA